MTFPRNKGVGHKRSSADPAWFHFCCYIPGRFVLLSLRCGMICETPFERAICVNGCCHDCQLCRANAAVGVHFLPKVISGSGVPSDFRCTRYGSGDLHFQIHSRYPYYSQVFHYTFFRLYKDSQRL